MTIVGHGVDLVESDRIARMVEEHGERFLQRCFTQRERDYAKGRKRAHEHLAGRFAVKEAVLKALGTGWRSGIAWTDVEVVLTPVGAPTVQLHGEAARLAGRQGAARWLVSITHAGGFAAASAIALSDP